MEGLVNLLKMQLESEILSGVYVNELSRLGERQIEIFCRSRMILKGTGTFLHKSPTVRNLTTYLDYETTCLER